jgi:hypothetical protein
MTKRRKSMVNPLRRHEIFAGLRNDEGWGAIQKYLPRNAAALSEMPTILLVACR